MDKRLVSFKSWDFDDGTTSTEQYPVHAFKRGGNFVITLHVEGPEGKAKRVKVWDVVLK